MPPVLSVKIRDGIHSKLCSVFTEYLLDDPRRQMLRKAIEEEHQLGVGPTTNERIRSKVSRYFSHVIEEYKRAKQERTRAKNESDHMHVMLPDLQRKVEKLADEVEGLKLVFMSALVLIFSNYPQCAVLLSGSPEELLKQHRASEAHVSAEQKIFDDVGGPELRNLVDWRNYLRIGIVLFKAYRNQGTLFRIATRLEGQTCEYITGGGATAATKRRCAIYKRQEKIFGTSRPTWRGTMRKMQLMKQLPIDYADSKKRVEVNNGMKMLCAGASALEGAPISSIINIADGSDTTTAKTDSSAASSGITNSDVAANESSTSSASWMVSYATGSSSSSAATESEHYNWNAIEEGILDDGETAFLLNPNVIIDAIL